MPPPRPCISVIIPVWQEMETICGALDYIEQIGRNSSYEVVVVDGDRQGSTIATIQSNPKWSDNSSIQCLISSKKGRANQMNYGAERAIAPVLLFLHADTKLPSNAFQKIITVFRRSPHITAGAFDLSIDSPRWIFRVIGKVSSWRSRLTRIPYGDQGIFIRRETFEAVGGFANVPLMEDVILMRSLKKRHMKIVFIGEPVVTSARRWEREGIIQCTLRNWCLIILYYLGAAPNFLAKFYR